MIDYALRGLRQCWISEKGRWSHIYHLDGRASPNESLPHSDVFYTLNVLLGMSRVRDIPDDIDLAQIFDRNVDELTRLPVAKYAFGMALWAAAELGFALPEPVKRKVRAILTDQARWKSFRAQDLGMLLIGVVAQTRAGENEWAVFADPLFRFLRHRFRSESGLFFDTPFGFRRRFASFATQIYLAMGCYEYGDFVRDGYAIHLADKCVRKLIALQGPQGEWPWFFDATTGRVLDFYEIYSVHQFGMGPALLEWAERHNVRGAREALANGFKWGLGQNQLGRSMLVPKLGLTVRSHVRTREYTTRIPRMCRALKNAYLGRETGLIDNLDVRLRLECRSYELGWILWSFGQRVDVRELTHDQAFSDISVERDTI
ncbi:hypothetical protein [Bradyrhizobium sp. CCBAU 51745]|uniref:hypothetical protein n=1 Tax=Bradyrhizobium sp. CCBAU 51745 TaxID=1325099 RepID=UPI002305EE47|nr:hypothetical protein [Bradyrhizobium sp. CCBAU 51745]